MESQHLNPVQIINLVTQLMSKMEFDKLGDLAQRDERVLEQLVQALHNGQGPVGFLAATGLSKAGEAAVEPLLEALQSETFTVRQASAIALGDIGDPRAVVGLIAALTDERDVVRQAAAVSLGKLKAVEALEPLLQTLKDESELVRKAAVDGVGMIGDARALPKLRQAAAEDTAKVAARAREVVQEIEGQRERE